MTSRVDDSELSILFSLPNILALMKSELCHGLFDKQRKESLSDESTDLERLQFEELQVTNPPLEISFSTREKQKAPQ